MNPPKSPTPRTDKEEWTAGCGPDSETVVWSDFARTLERELAAAKAECERLRFLAGPYAMSDDSIVSAYAELARLRALVGTIRSQLNLTVRNVSDITPEEHSHETGEAIDRLRAEVERWKTVAAALSETIRAAINAAMKGTP
jgi:hypothetical protein